MGTPVLKSLKNLIFFHLGSVALGSLLISLVQLLRAALQYIQTYLKGSTNRFINGLLTCCQCCLYLFEKFIKFLSRNAYIEVGK